MPFSGRRNIISIVGFMLGVTMVLSVLMPWTYEMLILPDWVYVMVGVALFIVIGQRYGRFKDKEGGGS